MVDAKMAPALQNNPANRFPLNQAASRGRAALQSPRFRACRIKLMRQVASESNRPRWLPYGHSRSGATLGQFSHGWFPMPNESASPAPTAQIGSGAAGGDSPPGRPGNPTWRSDHGDRATAGSYSPCHSRTASIIAGEIPHHAGPRWDTVRFLWTHRVGSHCATAIG